MDEMMELAFSVFITAYLAFFAVITLVSLMLILYAAYRSGYEDE